MKAARVAPWGVVALVTVAIAWSTQASPGAQQPAAPAAKQTAPAAAKPAAAAAPGAKQAGAPGSNPQAEFGTFPAREFLRLDPNKLKWNATENNKLGVQTAVLEGDPSKPGFYLTINRFPPGVMSRPHTHPDERHCVVIKGTWYTGEGTKEWAPAKEVGLKVGEYMRHPSGGLHYDGAHDEEVWVLISGYGPTRADVLDHGELFGRIPPAAKSSK